MHKIIYNKQLVNSTQACINHSDRGFSLGHGLFETILINKNTIPAYDYHWKRLAASAPLLGITLPFTYDELESMIHQLIVINHLQDKLANARITLTHGDAARGILPANTPTPNFLITTIEGLSPKEQPFSALVATTRKNEHTLSARVKTISYIDNILAAIEARKQGYDEAILLNTSSYIADGSVSNIFMVKEKVIITPPIEDGALPGVVRSILLSEFSKHFSFKEKSINQNELLDADEIFLTNALMGIKSVSRLNKQQFTSFSTANALRDLLRKEKNYL